MSADSDEEITDNVQTRWPYTNDLLAALILGSFVIVIAAVAVGVATGRIDATLPVGDLVLGYLVIVLIAATWAFGTEAVKAYREFRK